jgi:hypothetical protein
METLGVFIISVILFVIIGCVQLTKFWQSLILILVTSFLVGLAIDQNIIFSSFALNVSGKSLGFFLLAVSLTFNLMSRTDLLVEELKKKDDVDKELIVREKWNNFMFPIYWFFWALFLALFIQLNFNWSLIVLLSILVAVIMFLLWVKLEEKHIIKFSIAMSIINLILFAIILF